MADIAAILDPTITELVALKLIKRRPKWDDEDRYREWWNVAKKLQRFMTVLVEVKTSLEDFRRDKKWSLPLPVSIAYLAMPKDLDIPQEKVPAAWGILEYRTVSNCVRLARSPVLQEVTIEEQRGVIFQIALRRDHHTRYERMREFRRDLAITRNAEVSRTRMIHGMQAMSSIVRGQHGSVEGALEWHGIKHFPDYFLVELRKLWGQVPAGEQRRPDPGITDSRTP